MKYVFVVALCCAAQVSAPLIGYVRDRAGDLRPLFGVAGALVTGEPIETGVLSSSFTGKAGLAKRASELVEYREGREVRRIEAPEGPAEFAFTEDGRPKWVRFAGGACLVWKGQTPEPVADCPESAGEPERIGQGWTASRDADGVWAVRTEPGREDAVYRVPEGASK